MFHNKKVKAEIIDVVSNIRKSKICRDYDGEYFAKLESRHRDSRDRWCSYQSDYPAWQREDDFYEYTREHSECYMIENDLTGELELHREFTWYEIKLKIRYCVSKKVYEKVIDIESRVENIKSIIVYCERKNPENIIDIYFTEKY